MRWLLLTTVAGVLAASVASFGSAAAPTISGGLVGTGVLTYGTASAPLSATKGYVMEWAQFAPGASAGWHFHRTAVAVAVTRGTLTLYDSADPSCRPRRFSAGQGFVEPPQHIHLARNEGTTPVYIYATYVGVPGGYRKNPTPLDVNTKAPGNCPGDIR